LLFSSENSVVSQINRYEADWQLVDPDDLIPEIDISEDLSARAAVDPYLDYVPGPRTPEYYPTPPRTPEHYPTPPRTPEHYHTPPRTPEYYPTPPADGFPLEDTLSPQRPFVVTSPPPPPLRSRPVPSPSTNPLRFRAGPAPPPPRPVKKISKRKAITIEQRAVRAEKKRQPKQKKGKHCKVCKLECNSLIAFADHIKSRSHVYRSGLTKKAPHCDVCDRDFPDKSQLEHHNRGRKHLRVVTQTA
jgi:Zinc-finger of C2H2 type